jgi:hypothetical protein
VPCAHPLVAQEELNHPCELAQDENVAVTARQLVGRDEELGAIVWLLDVREDLPGALVLSGEAGIGKTTVWLAGVDAGVPAVTGFSLLDPRRPRPSSRSRG